MFCLWLKGKITAAVSCRAISLACIAKVGLSHSSSASASLLTVQYFQLFLEKCLTRGMFLSSLLLLWPLLHCPPAFLFSVIHQSLLLLLIFCIQHFLETFFTFRASKTVSSQFPRWQHHMEGKESWVMPALSISLSYHQEQFLAGCCVELRWSADETQGSTLFQPHHVLPDGLEGRKPQGAPAAEKSWAEEEP